LNLTLHFNFYYINIIDYFKLKTLNHLIKNNQQFYHLNYFLYLYLTYFIIKIILMDYFFLYTLIFILNRNFNYINKIKYYWDLILCRAFIHIFLFDQNYL